MSSNQISPEDMPPPAPPRKTFHPGNFVADGRAEVQEREIEEATEKVRKLIIRAVEARMKGQRLSEIDPKAGDPAHLAHRYFRNPNTSIIKNYAKFIDDILDYFEYLDANPLQESKLVSFQGESVVEQVPKMRAGTMKGMFLFIGVRQDTWSAIKTGKIRQHLQPVIEFAEALMYDRKYNGAAADMLNATLVMRDLGISDKTELTGANGGPIQTVNNSMTPEEAMRAYAATLNNSEG